ncbi:hypothetical protein LPJ78_001753 [Coemansia sp. RSA 989]|nr:hypothetical protein LPJ68_001524 [Coemansia sp. RSA 1086]KAJ1751448.1 hypothetical protein LPJ79_002026 [Coemansia sp. RSA 1821]KAJ1866492.1 hypothetical protein LPJ78_001753 [Coemansia sp. RSA 989]KAJ1873860.1 hypothetical protein LPJ55_001994 [Coemansia sp. RSA 990]KAJ2629744.1 hypothetical protein H4R22_003133 [Coemansia sp. RSA 1290]KAJ2670401.1 hypothetical protein IWW42_003970 [Coemansia sp. RSA 1085]
MSGAKDEIPAKPVDSSSLHMLVYSYLLHNNCGRTAQAFARTCGLASSGRLASAEAPTYLSSIFNAIDEDISVDALPNPTPGKGKAALAGKAIDTNGHSAKEPNRQSTETSLRKDSGADGLLERDVCSDGQSETERANELIDHHIEYLRIRQSICTSIEAGEPEVASDLLSTYFRPVLLPATSSVMPAVNSLPSRREFNALLLRLRLDTQYYVELIANHQELDALEFGQRTLWKYPDFFDSWLEHSLGFSSHTSLANQPFSRSFDSPCCSDMNSLTASDQDNDEIVSREELKMKRAEIVQHITNVGALAAYPNPRKSSLAYLLSQDRRRELAEAVNAAILRCMKFPKEPSLVFLVRQLATASNFLAAQRSSASKLPSDAQSPWSLHSFVNSDSVSHSFA